MKTDIEIANSIEIKPIYEIADKLGIDRDLLEPYGRYKAKLPLSLIDKSKIDGKKLILVSAISPTPAGEGKTPISIGLTEGLNRIGKQATVVLREPSWPGIWNQRRSHRWWLLSSRSNGRHQPALYR